MADQQVHRGAAEVHLSDTIAAIATAPGGAAVAIVRLSGPDAHAIAMQLCGRELRPRHAELCAFRDQHGQPVDQGLALYFPAPHSYTGEHVVELHGHGGTVVSNWLLTSALALGARAAEPGEFTLRAFLNGKLDLAQAEAVADLVASGSRTAARAALRSLTGRFSSLVATLQQAMTELRVQVEAWLDFPDEDLALDDLAPLRARADDLQQQLAALTAGARQGAVLRDGITIVIAGVPNAGKSSLLNQLAGHEAAIVTRIPGTTRDTLREHLSVDGLPLNVIDTAGLRDTDDPVELEGVRRARGAIGSADRVLWVADIRDGIAAALAAARLALGEDTAFTLVANKTDLLTEPASQSVGLQSIDPATERAIASAIEQSGEQSAEEPCASSVPIIALSALTGEGLDALRSHLKELAGWAGDAPGTFSARTRHVDALTRAQRHVNDASAQLAQGALELAAEELRAAQAALSELTGEVDSDQLLGEIFSRFCIGK